MEQLHERSEVAGGYQVNRRQLLASGAALVGLSVAGGLVQAVGAEDNVRVIDDARLSWVGVTRDLSTGYVINTSVVPEENLDDDPTQFDMYDGLKDGQSFTIAFNQVLMEDETAQFWYKFEEFVTAHIEPLAATRDSRDWWIRFTHPDHDDVTMVTSMSGAEVHLRGFNETWDLRWWAAKRFYVGSIEPGLREVKMWAPRKLQFVD
jgi:hypothetical protein